MNTIRTSAYQGRHTALLTALIGIVSEARARVDQDPDWVPDVGTPEHVAWTAVLEDDAAARAAGTQP